MGRNIIQLAGTNGSGKSTPLSILWDKSNDKVSFQDSEDRGVNATWFRDLNIVTLGEYRTACGGCDGITGNGGLARANEALRDILSDSRFNGCDIIFEGLLMASYVNTMRLKKIILELEPSASYTVVLCTPPLQVCIDRVYSRNGGKKINEANVEGRYNTSLKDRYDKEGEEFIRCIIWDNSDVAREDMYTELMDIVEGTTEKPREFVVRVEGSRTYRVFIGDERLSAVPGWLTSSQFDKVNKRFLTYFALPIPPINYPVFNTFWLFASLRQKIFYAKISGADVSLHTIEDKAILDVMSGYKFTNVFRASDRVSQYLIRNVIYAGSQDPEQVIYRILLFKIFNKESTWEYITERIGTPRLEDFKYEALAHLLDEADGLFNNAYMLTGSKVWGYDRKHWNYLRTLHEILVVDEAWKNITNARSLHAVYEILLSYPLIAEFLAYQFAIDINYSTVTNFDENSFVYPGGGAVRGLARLFDISPSQAEDMGLRLINWMAEHQEYMFERVGVEHVTLFGRPLHLIDIQNLCCEVDKLSRALFPADNAFGKSRIKEHYTPSNRGKIEYWFPPKWGINEAASRFMASYSYIE